MILDRYTGKVVWEAPIPDDVSSTVSIGPDGSLYAATLGILSIMSTDKKTHLGVDQVLTQIEHVNSQRERCEHE